MHSKIDIVWANIIKNEGQIFKTKRQIPYTYIVGNNYILINNDKRRLITKESISRALFVENPTPAKLDSEAIWGPSYVYGLITDERIKA